jgi:hypothetical protein
MILVAILALLLGRSVHFSDLARYHAQERSKLVLSDVDLYLAILADPPGAPMHSDSGHPIAKAVVPIREYITYHLELEKKYKSASRHPWLPVTADPSPPPTPSKAQVELYRGLLNEI